MQIFKKNPIIYGTILLSFSGLLCRAIGFFYRLFVAQSFGEEAIGIFQLTSPVLMLAFSFTCAGLQTAVSKYTASCFGIKNEALAKKFLLAGCALSLFTATLYSILIYTQADNISLFFLHEKRCTPLLRICALSFPFSALHSCFNGYFYGKKDTKIPSFTQIIEQLIRVGSVLFLYHYLLGQNQTPTIALTCIGMVLGEICSFSFSFFFYVITNDTHTNKKVLPFSNSSDTFPLHRKVSDGPENNYFIICKQLITLSIPLTMNRVIVNLLQSYEAVSIPVRLKEYGYSSETALSIYGVLTGMAMSLVLFPSTFAHSVSVLLLPSVSEASSAGNRCGIKSTIQKSIFFSVILGLGCTFVFYTFGTLLGELLFHSIIAGKFIRQISFLCPFLYLHITLGSILNGLKKTTTTLLINIFSLLFRLSFVVYLIPSQGIKAYLWGLLLSELFSSLFCIYSLRKHFF